MIDRLTICEEICKLVRVKRANPRRTLLSKREMTSIWRVLIAYQTKITQLESQIKNLSGK